MPQIAARLDADTKRRFAALAEGQGLSESALLRRMVVTVIAGAAGEVPTYPRGGRGRLGGKVDFRLGPDELAAAQAIAEPEGRSVAAWIRAMLRWRLQGVVPFNRHELHGLGKALVALNQLGRNLNELVRYFHRTGRVDPDSVKADALAQAVANLRDRVQDLTDRASARYTEGD